jgi:hypothetical protein
MPDGILARIRAAIRAASYDMTIHAVEEMAEDRLVLDDIEAVVLTGEIVKIETDDPRGTRYTIRGPAADQATPVDVVGRFTPSRRFLIITVYEVTE